MRLLMEHHVDSQPLETPHLKPSWVSYSAESAEPRWGNPNPGRPEADGQWFPADLGGGGARPRVGTMGWTIQKILQPTALPVAVFFRWH
jgi:hypothetical protein